MKTALFAIAMSMFALSSVAPAQQLHPIALRNTTFTMSDSVRPPMPKLEPATASRSQHVKHGAIIGAITLGAAAGLAAYTQVNFGCDVSSATGSGSECHADRDRTLFSLAAAGGGAILGGIGGALIGAALHSKPKAN